MLSTRRRTYTSSAAAAIARLEGSVHGVVVQITIRSPFSRQLSGPTDVTGNPICTVGDTWSSYSTSASASAVFSTHDHITGRWPRYRPPFIANWAISPAILASAGNFIVRYGSFQSPITPRRLNSVLCTPTQCSANSLHSRRNSRTGTSSLSLPCSL